MQHLLELDGNGHTISGGAKGSVLNTGRSTYIHDVTLTGGVTSYYGGVQFDGVANPQGSCVGVTDNGWNVGGNAIAGAAADLGFGVVRNNGGPTNTYLPGEGSSVLDVIPPGTAGVCDASTPTDQRGAKARGCRRALLGARLLPLGPMMLCSSFRVAHRIRTVHCRPHVSARSARIGVSVRKRPQLR